MQIGAGISGGQTEAECGNYILSTDNRIFIRICFGIYRFVVFGCLWVGNGCILKEVVNGLVGVLANQVHHSLLLLVFCSTNNAHIDAHLPLLIVVEVVPRA